MKRDKFLHRHDRATRKDREKKSKESKLEGGIVWATEGRSVCG